MSLKEKIFSAQDITKELIEIPEWGVSVELRSMTAGERANLTESTSSDGKVKIAELYAAVVIASIYDPTTGLPLFTNQDREAILSKNGAVIERLAQKAMGTSGMTEQAVEEAGVRFPQES